MAYQGPLNKLDDYRWEIPRSYKNGMRTNAVIFTDEKMIPSLREDNAPEQAANVAFLPGILGSSLAMPDIHWGYGFPIGGVAAMDAEEGVISPGGIGFDINCLCEGSRISTELGGWIRIEDFEREFGTSIQADDGFALCLMGGSTAIRTLGNGPTYKRPSVFMKKMSDRTVLKVITRTGLESQCSEDHPLLTSSGMKCAAFLNAGDRTAVSFFQGVELDRDLDKKEIVLAKVFGYMLGKGALYRTGRRLRACAYGQKADMEQMRRDLRKLGYGSMIYERSVHHNIPAKYKVAEFTSTNWELHVRSRKFTELLLERGMPVGRKNLSDHRIPEWIMKASLAVKRAFIAGLFGAKLTEPRTHSRTEFDAPIFARNKNDEHLGPARSFFIDLMKILEELGVETTEISEGKDHFDQNRRTSRIRLLISANEDNLVRLYRTIGYEYSERKSRIAEIAVKYILLKKEMNARGVKAARRAKELKRKGLTLEEVQGLLVTVDINTSFLESHYHEDAGQGMGLEFVPFKEFLASEMGMLTSAGFLYDEIVSVKEVRYSGLVYDFTVEDTHNFVANGMIVSNCGVRLVRTDLTENDVRPGSAIL